MEGSTSLTPAEDSFLKDTPWEPQVRNCSTRTKKNRYYLMIFCSNQYWIVSVTGLAQCAELCWQLRGMAGKRQVKGAKVGLQHNLGLGGAVVISIYRLGFPNARYAQNIYSLFLEYHPKLEKQGEKIHIHFIILNKMNIHVVLNNSF